MQTLKPPTRPEPACEKWNTNQAGKAGYVKLQATRMSCLQPLASWKKFQVLERDVLSSTHGVMTGGSKTILIRRIFQGIHNGLAVEMRMISTRLQLFLTVENSVRVQGGRHEQRSLRLRIVSTACPPAPPAIADELVFSEGNFHFSFVVVSPKLLPIELFLISSVSMDLQGHAGGSG